MDHMDDVQMSQQSSAAHQYQCRQPQMPPTAPTFTPHPRSEQAHYDPVHEANQFYLQANNPNSSARPPAPQAVPHWQSSSYMPIPHWQTYTDPHRPHFQAADPAGYSPARTPYMDIPWSGDARPYDQMPFGGYGGGGHYTGPLGGGGGGGGGNGPFADVGNGPNPPGLVPGNSSHMRGYTLHTVHPDLWQRPQYTRAPPMAPNAATPRRGQRTDETSADRTAVQQAMTSSEHHRFSANPGRRTHRTRGLPMPEHWATSSRRLTHHGHLGHDGISDDDDDESIEAEYRRNAELLFDPENEERAMAAMRGALALSGKKVTSREFLRNLEVVPIDQIPESEKTCSICYETIGTENPEGLTEKALRLPKCKHIFGDICIKKWCQDSDTCPYCRDKLPSELSVKKGLVNEFRTAQRERMRVMERARRSSGLGWLAPPQAMSADPARTQEPSSHREEVPRTREEVEAYVPAGDPWALSWSNRFSGIETSERPSERRRAARGRLGTNRPNHAQGRPTSVGSSRLFAAHQNAPHHQNPAQRSQVPNNPPAVTTTTTAPTTYGNHDANHAPHRSITPGLTRQSSNPGSSTARTFQPEFTSAGSEAASPPVAVGSGGSARERQQDFRRSLDQYTTRRSDEWSHSGSPTRHAHSVIGSPTSLGSPFHASQGTITSPLHQHPPAENSHHHNNNNHNTNPSEDESVATGPLFSRWSR